MGKIYVENVMIVSCRINNSITIEEEWDLVKDIVANMVSEELRVIDRW